MLLMQAGEVAYPCPASSAALAVVGKDGVTLPKVLKKVEPEFTPEARRARLAPSQLGLFVKISEDGEVCDIRVVSPIGLGLDEAAIAAVRKWRVAPATRDGKPVRMGATIYVDFKYEGEVVDRDEKRRTDLNIAMDSIKNGSPKSIQSAVKKVEELSAKKYAPADAYLALLLIEGRLLAEDDARALTLARRAEKMNSPVALYALALIYEESRGVTKDEVRALSYYKEASTAGIAGAQIWLAARGEREANIADARRYYKLCAAQAIKACQDKLASLGTK